jgi:hypothetical protein
MDIERVFKTTPSLERAFRECLVCMKDVYARAKDVAVSPPNAPREFAVRCGGVPLPLLSVRRNLFSSFFQATYGLLSLPEERRHLYGKINYLFRIWVTAADNLLDDEDKIVMDLRMAGDSHIMRQVVSVMTADRVLYSILDEAVHDHVITPGDAGFISRATLQVLLPSAAQEASEEKGVIKRPKPEYVLRTIHRIKTGLLFLVPLFGPEHLDKGVDRARLALCRDGLNDFGIGCQLLDDVRDIARDNLEKRQNYVLSLIAQSSAEKSRLRKMDKNIGVDTKILEKFPAPCSSTVKLADQRLRSGLGKLDQCGLGLGEWRTDAIVRYMFKALDVEEAREWLRS